MEGQLDPMIGRIFFNKYTLVKKLGEGSFGAIYSARTDSKWYALKFENKNKGQNLLENEAYIMSYLKGKRIPFIKSFGFSGEYNVLVMELMGKSLENIFENLPTKKMSVNCVAKLGSQMIEILEFIHNKHIIHRDIKPDNFVMGREEKSKYVYLLDFGLAKKYRSSTTLKHYPIIKKRNLTGTARYASINALNGMTQSRRDDLEAVGYVLLYFLRGKLPWQGLHVKNKEDRYRKIMEIKIETTPYELCKGFPKEFEDYVEYSRKLEYEEDPDYDYIKNLFNNILKKDENILYDWDIINKTTFTSTTSNTSKKKVIIKNKKELGDAKNEDNEDNDDNNDDDKDDDKDNDRDKDDDENDDEKDSNDENNELNDNKENDVKDNVVKEKRISDIAKKKSDKNYENKDKKRIIHSEKDGINISNNKIMNSFEKKNKKNVNKKKEENDYGNIAALTEEGNDKDKSPNISGLIHNKEQLEKGNKTLRNKDDTCCIII